MWLPHPYPDEVIGSLLTRGCRALGISWTRMLDTVTGTWPRKASFAMPVEIQRVSCRSGVAAEVLLNEHTLFPYVTAFTSPSRHRRLRQTVLAPGAERRALILMFQPIHGAPTCRRYCLECLEEDTQRFGEDYWHRTHLLPAVEICPVHGTPLCQTDIPFQRTAGDRLLLMPRDLASTRMRLTSTVPLPIRRSIATHSAAALQDDFKGEVWLSQYRVKADRLGYRIGESGLSGSAIVRDLDQFYGHERLTLWGCPIDHRLRNPWPALLVRPDSPTGHKSVKHILMQSFLEHAPDVSHLRMNEYAPKGKKPRDYSMLDALARERMSRFIQRVQSKNKRYTVKRLLKITGLDAAYRRHRPWFPITRQLIRSFRMSPLAAKPLMVSKKPANAIRSRKSCRNS